MENIKNRPGRWSVYTGVGVDTRLTFSTHMSSVHIFLLIENETLRNEFQSQAVFFVLLFKFLQWKSV